MKALISPNERVATSDGNVGTRIADVSGAAYPVAEPFYWLDCADDVTRDTHYFDGSAIVPMPPPPPPPEPPADGGPSVVAE